MHRCAILFAVGLLAGCDGMRGTKGRIVDSEGKPIAGASVRLFKATETPPSASPIKTDANGSYNLAMIDNSLNKKKLRLIIAKDGFKNYDATFDLSLGQSLTVDITLERDTDR
jgi:hypothetical protein